MWRVGLGCSRTLIMNIRLRSKKSKRDKEMIGSDENNENKDSYGRDSAP